MRLPSGPQNAQKILLGTWEQSRTARRSMQAEAVYLLRCGLPAALRAWAITPSQALTLLDPEALPEGPFIVGECIQRLRRDGTLQPPRVGPGFLQQWRWQALRGGPAAGPTQAPTLEGRGSPCLAQQALAAAGPWGRLTWPGMPS